MHIKMKPNARERGSAMVEFTLATSLFLAPLLFGTMVIGQNLIREMEVTQVCRDAGHMHSYGVDFSLPANQNLLVNIARGLSFQTSSGNGVVILSTLTYVDSNDCIAGGYQPNGSSCANFNHTVITRRIVVGNASVKASSFGTPNASLIDSSGNVSPAGYLNNTSTRADGFASLVALTSGQYSYLSEMYVDTPDLSWWSYLGATGVSARSIF
jgi:hypothetical protein